LEKRKPFKADVPVKLKSGTPVPVDYVQMVKEVFEKNFSEGLKELAKIHTAPKFFVGGRLFGDEIVFFVSLLFEGRLAATTVWASSDFDPNASAPKADTLLGLCIDGIGSFYSQYLDPKKPQNLELLAGEALSDFEGAPFEWTKMDINKRSIYLKVDKMNSLE